MPKIFVLAPAVTYSVLFIGVRLIFLPARQLVVRGQYRLIRNPMYLGAGLALAGARSFIDRFRSSAVLAETLSAIQIQARRTAAGFDGGRRENQPISIGERPPRVSRIALGAHRNGVQMERKRVGIILFEDIEVLDFCGPFEVFSATRVNEEMRRDEPSPFEVLLVAERPGPVTTTGGMMVLPHYTFEKCPRLEIVVSPGGWGARNELKNPIMLDWLRARAAEAETVAAVCTGSMLLGFAGLLDGLHATTHWRSLDWMRDSFPSVTVEYDKHFVEDGRVFTSAGISAGIDMSLKVVAHYFGEGTARATARHMEYPYPESDARRISIGA